MTVLGFFRDLHECPCVEFPNMIAQNWLAVLGAPSNQAPRIIGGTPATELQYPFVASLQQNGFPFCAGSLIADEWVLTAAHCLTGQINPSDYTVGIYKHNIGLSDANDNACAETIQVSEVHCHEDYDDVNINNDICLVKLSQAPRCVLDMPYLFEVEGGNGGVPDDGTTLTIAGWGDTDIDPDDVTTPDILQRAEGELTTCPAPFIVCSLPPPPPPSAPAHISTLFPAVFLLSSADCNTYLGSGYIGETMFCAGVLAGGTDACQGDSGGPIFIASDGDLPAIQVRLMNHTGPCVCVCLCVCAEDVGRGEGEGYSYCP